MKCIVETTGDFMLLNSTFEEISAQRACVTTMTPFVDIRINKKELRVLARNLPRNANDEDFNVVLNAMKDEDANYCTAEQSKDAAAAYCAEFGLDVDGQDLEATEIETKAQKKARLKAEQEQADAEAFAALEAEEVEAEKAKTKGK